MMIPEYLPVDMHKKSISFVIFQLIVKFLCSFQIYLIILSCEKLPHQALEMSSSALSLQKECDSSASQK